MKKASLYLFLFVYGTVMLKPVVPYIKDFAAHLLFYKDHMLTVHAHNGKYHVHAEVALDAKNDHQEKGTGNIKKDNDLSEHLLYTTSLMPVPAIAIDWPVQLAATLCTTFVGHQYPPPRG